MYAYFTVNRILFLYFCFFNLIIFNSAEGNDATDFEDKQIYNIYKLYRQFQSSLNLKNKTPVFAKNFHFNRLDNDFSFNFASQNSSKCLRDISYTFQSLSNLSNQWALRIIDSFAKPQSGFLQGNFMWIGEYNECINIYAPPKASDSTTGNFNGQYCTLSFPITMANNSIPLSFGICLPDSCSPTDLLDEIKLLLYKAGGFPVLITASSLMKTPLTITCKPRERHLNTAAIVVIVLLSVFIIFALLGSSITIVKYIKKILQEQNNSSLIINIFHQENTIIDQDGLLKKSMDTDNTSMQQSETSSNKGLSGFETFLTSFCVFTNGAKLLNTDSSEGQLLCIHGIRFLSMSWVILGHTYAFIFQNLRNKAELFNTVKDDFAFQAVTQGFFSVDSFFVLSGFLLTYLAMKEFSKNRSINWIYFYIHRFIRLTPVYMVVLAFSATVFYYLGSGPFWPVGDYDPICRKNWWWNLLYINNFAGMDQQCMGWSWYLANDMQFFIISPLFLIALWKFPIIGYSLVGWFILITVLCNSIITYKYNLMVGLIGFLSASNLDMATIMLKFTDFFVKIYIKPYTRFGPYLVGIAVGHLVFKHKTSNRPKLNLVYLCIGWFIASAITLTVMYGLYHNDLSLISRCFYNGVSRVCFALGLCWVIYVCLTNQGGFVNSILSFKLFIPLSRLTYCAYLIHPLIIAGYMNSLKVPLEFSHPTMVLIFLGFMVVTYALSLPVSLILESPIVSLEKMVRNKFSKVQKTETKS